MNLLIISHTPHYQQDGQLVGWGPTIREINYLASRFESVRHLAVLYQDDAPPSSLPYSADNISFIPVRPAGGKNLSDKFDVIRAYWHYWRVLDKAVSELGAEDIVHVRCPSNISLLALMYLVCVRRVSRYWFKYAGNWQPTTKEDYSYTFQRWWLNLGLHRGSVTINGRWKNQPSHIYSFLNPSLTDADLESGRLAVQNKTLVTPVQIVFVGRVETAKGSGRLLEISRGLLAHGLDFQVHIIGDSEERPAFERLAIEMGLENKISFYGWMLYSQLIYFYEKAHFFVLPTASEGWPKVLSEGMACGVVPLAGAVSSIPQILREFKTGMAINPLDTQAFVDAILAYINEPERWLRESRAAQDSACHFTYASYLGRVKTMFLEQWKVSIP
jgi:glycosyltransferase involved in cell wall biosynthesis